jgi:transglutaminase-like putative cysteine protease
MTRRPEASVAGLSWACAALAGGVLLNVDRVPPWSALTALSLIAWRFFSAHTGRALPGLPARIALALTLMGVVLVRFHTLNGLIAGTTLLMLMAALKLLETRGARDQRVVIAAALFLLLAACLDRQYLIRTPLYALEAWLCCAAFAAVADPSLRPRAALALAGRSLLVAVTLALLLFVFFPRLSGSLWTVPSGGAAVSGLSDTMTPDGIERLILEYDPAFRASFAGAPPPAEQRYWRGPVLHRFDGHTWRRDPLSLQPRLPLESHGEAVRYRVALEPSRQRWWFALDLPVEAHGERVFLNSDYQLIGAEPVNQLLTYEALSYLGARMQGTLGALARREDTALPAGLNPRTHELATLLRAHAASDADFVRDVLDYLARNGFVYTLEPAPLGHDSIDDFLFRTREGFCGHYASAFVTLMRAAQVPAHVVTGYLGGEWNPVGGYLLVRQADAHAWAEVWLEGRGWTRVDPTAVVAPERLRRGVMDLMPEAFSAGERLLHSAWVTSLLQRWDAANTWWSEHVIKFDYATQVNLLERLGIHGPDARYLGWAFVAALLLWLALTGWYLARGGRRVRPDALARAYLKLCAKLARAGAARAPHEGPLALARSVRARSAELGARVQPLCEAYARLRYGPQVPGAFEREVAEFARAVARLPVRGAWS